MFRNILLCRVRGHWERLRRRIYISNTVCLCVYAVAFAQHCMSIKCSVLINCCGRCGETDLQFGAHFAKNDIIRVAFVEEVENIGSLSSYVKYFLKFQAAMHKLVPRCNFDSPYKNMYSMFYTSLFAAVIWEVYGWTESQPYVA